MQPQRVVIDSLSEIRLLAQSSLRYRRQVLALKHYFAKRGATVLLLDDLTLHDEDFWPSITQTADGRVYLVDGARTSLVRVDGLDGIRRLPEGTVKARLHRGREILRAKLPRLLALTPEGVM